MHGKKRGVLALKILTVSAMLSALSIVFGKFLAFNVGEVLRFSFENLPIIFAAYALGPIAGMAVGAVADLVGCVLVGYAINPLVTLGAVLIGGVSGICFTLLKRLRAPLWAQASFGVTLGHLVGSVVVKTVGLSAFYAMALGVLILSRLLNYSIIGIAEGLILFLLFKNKYFSSYIRTFTRPYARAAVSKENNEDKESDENDL